MELSSKHILPSAKSGGTLQQRAYEYLKRRIMNRTLKPGEYFTDSQVTNELHISRTPVRNALHRLEHEGFLINQAGRGWKVYSLSLEDIQEVFDIKVELEGMIARRAAACEDEKKRTTLRNAMRRLKGATAANDHEAWRKADMELHRRIFAMCANERASRIINDLNDQWYRVRIGLIAIEGRMQRSLREHEAFVESILAGDGDGAEREMRQHLNNLREELVRVLVNLVLPFALNGL